MTPTKAYKKRIYESYLDSGHLKVDRSATVPPDPARHARQAAIHRYFPKDRDARILDLGCGFGGFTRIAQDLGFSRTEGVDVAESLIAEGLRRGTNNLFVGELMDTLVGTSDATYELVAALDVLEHFEPDLMMDVLDQVQRVLIPGGGILIHVPNAGGLFSGVVRYGDMTHEWAFTDSSLRQLLNTIGFRDVEVTEDAPVAHGPKSWARLVVWTVGTLPVRLLYAAETGRFRCHLTQNVWAFARRPKALRSAS